MLAFDGTSPPSLSAAYGSPEAALVAPAFSRPLADAAPGDIDRFRTFHRRGKRGVVVFAASSGAVAVGTIVAVAGSVAVTGGSSAGGAVALGGLGLAVAGAAGVVVGEVMLFDGAIGAAKVAGIDRTVGWVGVGLAVGAIPAGMVLGAIDEDLTSLSSLMTLGGIVCGAVQLAESGSAGRDRQWISWHLVPAPRGVGLVGTF